MKYNIRKATDADYRGIEELVRDSFWNVYRPGCLEHYVIHNMRGDRRFISDLEFVMVDDKGELIGQNCFVRAEIQCDSGEVLPVFTMGPICIANEYKRQGYGKLLLDYSLKAAREYGGKAVCFEGNIDFYGKSGFGYASEYGIRYHGVPEGEDQSFFLAIELEPGYLNGVTGEYSTPDCYLVDEREAERFDEGFPKKKKLRLPGQLF